ncbi:MAG: MarR family transcriptional regulator [Candidatus Protistobacter heckmanni]|nr:MarR family transcriptional regulator [Candidatus Protistobacter heckmanni]
MPKDSSGVSPSRRLASIDDLLLYRLGRLTAAAGTLVIRLCEGGYGITRREWGVLGMLHGEERLMPSVLAERAGLDRTRVSRAITALVKKKLIKRSAARGDGRLAVVSLTPAGERLYAELMPQVQEINRKVLSVLDEDEAAQFDAWLARLHASAAAVSAQMGPALPRADRRRGGRTGRTD